MTPTDLCNWNHPVIDHIALYSSRSIISVGMYLFIYILSVQIFCLLLLRDKVYLSFQWHAEHGLSNSEGNGAVKNSLIS